ncbi:MAG: trimethylamine methyltransferase family protein [Planctomycetes bacterium]|nr:trimethylamine methyltransferase family protein [Planctomycetota bacterium]
MRIAASARVLNDQEIRMIHGAALRILSETGISVENESLLQKLADVGAKVDRETTTVCFAPEFIERFIDESNKFDWENVEPSVSSGADVFQGYYLDPDTDEYLPWTGKRLADYSKLARYLDNVGHAAMLGCPIEGIDRRIIPLVQRYYCWKLGMAAGGSIWDTRLCPFILEMCEEMGRETGKDARDYFTGMVFFTSALKLPRSEAEQFVFFAERGLPVSLCSMTSAGGTAPVTLAGAVAEHLAEVLAARVIHRTYYGGRELHISSTIAPYDMRTLMYAYGRPERQIVNLIMSDMARYYKAEFHGHGGHTDAKKPSAEAGAQRALTTIPTLMACGRTYVGAGKLSMDEIGSPVQMVIDNEYVGALKRFARGCDITEETLAVDVVNEVGPGKLFIDHEHTARHFRGELWEPKIWAREMFAGWMASGARTDVDKARDEYHEIMKKPDFAPGFSEACGARFEKIMKKAVAAVS